jgi:hypothetical protein
MMGLLFEIISPELVNVIIFMGDVFLTPSVLP